jgi:hypothetical protein
VILSPDHSSYIDDSRLALATQIAMGDMRNWLLTLYQDEYVDLAFTTRPKYPAEIRSSPRLKTSLGMSLKAH